MLRHSVKYTLFALHLMLAIHDGEAQNTMTHKIITLPPADTSLQQITAKLSENLGAQATLQKKTTIKSQSGTHEHYDLLLAGFPIYLGTVKRNRFTSGKTTLSFPAIHLPAPPATPAIDSTVIHTWAHIRSINHPKPGATLQWIITGPKPQLVWVLTVETGSEYNEILIDQQGRELSIRPLSFNTKPDSLVAVSIFRPDPITAAETTYGVEFADYNDATSPALEQLLATDSITVRWDSGLNTWTLTSDYVAAKDLSFPDIPPPTSATGSFTFTREEPAFEYVNAFYHINRQQQFIQSLGFTNLVNYPIQVDAHAREDDQSTFYPTPGNERIEFGDGGVDDAEDADVIIHEYGHAINYSAAPGTSAGPERLAMEEGTCDYYALSYSRAISDYQRDIIFNWDGHNEFWTGRQLDPRRTYPSDLSDEIYADGIMWTTALADAEDQLGRETTHTLLFNAFYSFFPFMTMMDGARLIMQADTQLYEAVHAEALSIVFCKRGLYRGCEDTLLTSLPLEDPYIGNTEAFAYSAQPLFIFPNERIIHRVQLLDLGGRLLYDQEFTDREFLYYEIDFPALRNGLFILRLSTDAGDFSFKLLRQLSN